MDEINESVTTQDVAETAPIEQTNESTEQTVNADNEDVTTSQVDNEKVPQTDEENSKFASFRREQEAKTQQGIDAHYDKLYGASNDVHSQADYDRAIEAQEQSEQAEAQAQQYKEAGLNPDLINELINNNPTVKQAQSIISKQQNDSKIESEVNELFAAFPDAKDSKIPDDVFMESITKGIPLVYAYSMYANKNSATMAEQKTLRGLQQNAAASPGALNGDQAEKSDYSNMPTADFNKLIERSLRGERIKI